jgi:anti-sigma factor RsiW
MMDCPEFRRSLSLMADGQLPPGEIGALEEHLGICAECARFARTVEAVQAWFRELEAPPAPPDLAERVLARLGEPGARLLALRPLLGRTAAAAAVLFLVTGSAALWTELGPSKEVREPPVRLTAEHALDRIMSEIARENAPRIDGEDAK